MAFVQHQQLRLQGVSYHWEERTSSMACFSKYLFYWEKYKH